MTREQIYERFKEFFGESKVDLQGSDIIVHWPTVTVTNEREESIEIWDLFAKISLSGGNLAFDCPLGFKRSTYNSRQWNSCYVHSHLPRLRYSSVGEWNYNACLGSGPIRATIITLQRGEPEETDWTLFCFELDKYVHVESLTGGPYIKMATVSDSGNSSNTKVELFQAAFCPYNNVEDATDMLEEFSKYAINVGALNFSFVDGYFTFGESSYASILNLTNCFISWIKQSKYKTKTINELKQNSILVPVIVRDNSIYFKHTVGIGDASLTANLGRTILTFKGQPIRLAAHGEVTEPQDIYILSPAIVSHIYYITIRFLNAFYGKSDINEKIAMF